MKRVQFRTVGDDQLKEVGFDVTNFRVDFASESGTILIRKKPKKNQFDGELVAAIRGVYEFQIIESEDPPADDSADYEAEFLGSRVPSGGHRVIYGNDLFQAKEDDPNVPKIVADMMARDVAAIEAKGGPKTWLIEPHIQTRPGTAHDGWLVYGWSGETDET